MDEEESGYGDTNGDVPESLRADEENDYLGGADDINRYDLDVEMSRTMSRRFISDSISSRESKRAVPKMGAGRDYPPPLPDGGLYTVVFDGDDDPSKPLNWSLLKRCLATAAGTVSAVASTVCSSMFSEGQTQIEQTFHVGREVATLGTFLFILGYTIGPAVFGPFQNYMVER